VDKIQRILRPEGQFILTVPYGVKGQTDWYRVYDHKSLCSLLTGFEIEKAEFYRRTDSATWIETSEAGASEIASPIETNCVALVAARVKKSRLEAV
jgi:hypothetical protein